MIAVTGALGFIGNRLLMDLLTRYAPEELVAVDHPVVAAKCSNAKAISSVPFFTHSDFVEKLYSASVRPDVIVHLGACSSTTEGDWTYLLENNVQYSQKLWQWCSLNGARFIYASSAATYGDGSEGFDDRASLHKFRPLNLYGKSKHDFDLWVDAQQGSGAPQPTQCVGLKFFNVFGPGEAHKGRMASMIYHAFKQMETAGAIKLFKSHRSGYDDGEQLRDFIYVDQVVETIHQFLVKPVLSGLYNVGTGKARSFRELGEAVFAAARRPVRINYIPMPEDIREKYQYFTEAVMAKSQNAGIVVASIPLEDGVRDYVEHLTAKSLV
jgi:ADP-L-glycero-D-manno-heptose 6-epimerase